jgi:hypothetical protein
LCHQISIGQPRALASLRKRGSGLIGALEIEERGARHR